MSRGRPKIVQFSTGKPMTGQVTLDDEPLDISDADLVVVARCDETTITGDATSLDTGTEETRGLWRYDWAPGDTDVHGEYELQLRVTLDPGGPDEELIITPSIWFSITPAVPVP